MANLYRIVKAWYIEADNPKEAIKKFSAEVTVSKDSAETKIVNSGYLGGE